jgi:N-carbamoyl-L-amino-acid hydrolase
VCRLALTELDGQGRDLVVGWAREAGLTVTIDQIGNVFMRRPGRNNSLPPIMTGSHIDTQPTGGKFDGNYGVLAGLEVVRTLNDHGIQTEAPIEVAFWTNEEGSRFVPVMMGSGVFAGAFTLEHAYAATDTDGKTVKDELNASATWATRCRASTPSAPTSRPTSSRARCWRTTARPSAWSPACWASAGTTAP